MNYDDMQFRMRQCRDLADIEGTEFADAIEGLCHAVERLNSYGADFETKLVLLTAENLCREFCEMAANEEDDDESLLGRGIRIPAELLRYFGEGQ